MTAQPITAQQFHDAPGVEDWRVLLFYNGACAHFRTGSFAKGLELLDEIGRLADAANHHPDVDLRYTGLTVRLKTHEIGWLSDRDVRLARQISAAAQELGVDADPTAVQEINLTIDVTDKPAMLAFWGAVLAYEPVEDEDVVDPLTHGPSIWFQPMREPRSGRNRIHVDVSVPHEQAEARIQSAIAAGGRLLSDEHAPMWWTLTDPEGNEVDIATWVGRE
jgi:4a-hydroxytetrahydrobiopterin dehydratase